jgi:A/G-specific adenine glycosylase
MTSETASNDKIETVQAGLLAWFALNRRDLPWRHIRDPYRILLAEIMLQQTQVDRVVAYYEAFLAQFPTLKAMADAPTSEVIRLWAGLGYNRRAVNLQRTAKAIVTEHGGAFPRTVEALRALPGIGPYTAGAIACFAFEHDVAFIDTNMRRVLHRLFIGVDVPKPAVNDRAILEIAASVLPSGQGWTWNQALIEFGALQCTARKPACVTCPLQQSCLAFPLIQTVLAQQPRTARGRPTERFETSNRYYRGRVVDALRDLADEGRDANIGLHDLGPKVRDDFSDEHVPWLYGVVRELSRDGLAHIAEERPVYVAGAEEPDGAGIRVRLP